MKQLLKVALGAAAGLALAGTAQAAAVINVASVGGAAYNYGLDLVAVPNSAVVCDFETPNCIGGFTFSQVAAPVNPDTTGVTPNVAIQPPGDFTQYASVLGPTGVALLESDHAIQTFSFFFGSPDSFNRVQFLDDANNVWGDFMGAQLTNGIPWVTGANAAVGYRAYFTITGTTPITKVLFSSTQNAFEFDRIAAVVAVPEPATWAMMLMGFFGLGAALRSRRSKTALSLA